MVQPRFWKNIVLKLSLLLAACGMSTMMFVESASAHGYIESPTSRAYLCKQRINTDCGQIQYEPQSVEGPGSFPQSGPPDGKIASGGVRGDFWQLDVQNADRWQKVNMQGGKVTFKWYLTAPHRTKEWKYFITKTNWNPNKPLSRADLDPVPFCYYNAGNTIPSNTVVHECNVPTDRSGYHLILGVWEIADTGNAFYQVMDVNFVHNRWESKKWQIAGMISAI